MGNVDCLLQAKKNIESVFVGKESIVENVLICLLAGGHILLEDVPGVGKTTLAKTLAQAFDCSFGRIQFTPDTLPSDIVGLSVYNMKTGEFDFKEGVVMNHILLADEINRTPPKTQASLLEAMAEYQVTAEGKVMQLPSPFMVIATQNPIEYLGTYPLPEAQMDRFMMRLSIGYPSREDEILMAKNELSNRQSSDISAVSIESLLEMKREVSRVRVSDELLGYMEDMIALTRTEESFQLGASPRAMLALMKAAMAKAYIEGRDYVKPDDVKAVAVNVLAHRIVLKADARMKNESIESILKSIVVKVKVPV